MRLNNNAHYFDMADIDGDQLPEIAVPNFLNNSVTVSRNLSTVGTPSLSAGRLPEIAIAEPNAQ
jgi:hypothetical protein